MSVPVRRVIYSLAAALGFGLMVPFGVQARLWRAELTRAPLDVVALLEPSAGSRFMSLLLMAFLGLVLAMGFLYAALSAGHDRAWRARENGRIVCRRCGSEVGFGFRRCPACDQQLSW